MIRYSLKCGRGHAFDSWFASAAAYDALAASGRLACAVCGGGAVEKAMMAPRVASGVTLGVAAENSVDGKNAPPGPSAPPEGAPPRPFARPEGAPQRPAARPLATPASPMEAALAEFRAKVEANTEDVGRRFATEARAIHEGDAPARAIRGEANAAEAKSLIEDGVPVLPLPFARPRQVN